MADLWITLIILAAGILGTCLSVWLLKPANEREFEEQLRNRPCLTDDEFVCTYYPDGDIPAEIPIKVRAILAMKLGEGWMKVLPRDNPGLVYGEIDPWDIYRGICKELGVSISLDDARQLEGTFDSIVQYLASKWQPTSG
jgi:hypothetical protein